MQNGHAAIMEPTTPSNKIHPPREFAERAESVLLERMSPGDTAPAANASGAQNPTKPTTGTCAICGQACRGGQAITGLADYQTAQHDLLALWLATEHRATGLDVTLHTACLEQAEQRMQDAQIVRDGTAIYFVDLWLGRTPILPTPLRMNADLRFTGQGVTIAFVDSGFYPHQDFTHPGNRILAIYDAVRGCLGGAPERLVSRDPAVAAWHGTMAACTAAGSGHASHGEYRGIASDARLVLVRTMTRHYRIRTPQVVRALEWIRENRVRHDIRVVNMSVGVDETTDSMEHPVIALVEELSALGVVMVAASGNNPSRPIKPPGAAPSAITVGGYNDHNSTEWMRREMWHSSYGHTPGGGHKPDLLAPAIWVAAPILPRTGVKREADALFAMAAANDDALMAMRDTLADTTAVARELRLAGNARYARSIVLARIAAEKMITPDYKHVDGTSFAAPIVSSVAAQILEARPALRPDQVKEILCTTAELLPGVDPAVQGHGVVSPARALQATLSMPAGDMLEPGMLGASR